MNENPSVEAKTTVDLEKIFGTANPTQEQADEFSRELLNKTLCIASTLIGQLKTEIRNGVNVEANEKMLSEVLEKFRASKTDYKNAFGKNWTRPVERIPIGPQMDQAVRDTYTKRIHQLFNGLVFRRIASVNLKNSEISLMDYIEDDGSITCIFPYSKTLPQAVEFYNSHSVQDRDRRFRISYNRFTATTAESMDQDFDQIDSPLFLRSYDGGHLSGLQGDLSQMNYSKCRNFYAPKVTTSRQGGDIVCGYPEQSLEAGRFPTLKKWFVCSQQFYRLATLLRHGPDSLQAISMISKRIKNYESLEIGERIEMFRHFILTGNNLSTNGYARALYGAGNQLGKLSKWEKNMISIPNYEIDSAKYPHTLPRIALAVWFGEHPGSDNYPRTHDVQNPNVPTSWMLQ